MMSIEELSTLYHKTLKIPRLQETIDAYLFMALTGGIKKDRLYEEQSDISFWNYIDNNSDQALNLNDFGDGWEGHS